MLVVSRRVRAVYQDGVNRQVGAKQHETMVMTDRDIQFLVEPLGKAPQTLSESIRLVSDASAEFCRHWITQDINNASATSAEAFQLLDHIQNELLRHRDKAAKLPNWLFSPLHDALIVTVGELIHPSTSDVAIFKAQQVGVGALPQGSAPTPLKLVDALNKLKHRDACTVNFTVSAPDYHELFVFTPAGMGRTDAIASFEVQTFCRACETAARAL